MRVEEADRNICVTGDGAGCGEVDANEGWRSKTAVNKIRQQNQDQKSDMHLENTHGAALHEREKRRGDGYMGKYIEGWIKMMTPNTIGAIESHKWREKQKPTICAIHTTHQWMGWCEKNRSRLPTSTGGFGHTMLGRFPFVRRQHPCRCLCRRLPPEGAQGTNPRAVSAGPAAFGPCQS